MFAVLKALNRRSSSGGKLSGCESEDLLRKANEELARGLLGFFSFSRWSRSLTTEVRDFLSGDECADLVLCASAESVEGRGRGGGGGVSLGACGGVEGFLRVKIGIGRKKTNCAVSQGMPGSFSGWEGRPNFGTGTCLPFRFPTFQKLPNLLQEFMRCEYCKLHVLIEHYFGVDQAI